jgi:hypothetical protein
MIRCPSQDWEQYNRSEEIANMGKDLVVFTRRTNNPKLQWLINKLSDAGIDCFIVGDSAHAPITMINRDDEEAAWRILGPIDDVEDDDDRWVI